jgi:hypothetical protein
MARNSDRKLVVVIDPDDHHDTLAHIRRLHARPLGRIVCEPHPSASSNGLARNLLAALGKHLDGTWPGSRWELARWHLEQEQTRELFLLRAHTQRYQPLRSLTNHAHDCRVNLWLFVHQDIIPAAVTHAIEAAPHETIKIDQFLTRWPIRATAATMTTTTPCPPAPASTSRSSGSAGASAASTSPASGPRPSSTSLTSPRSTGPGIPRPRG